MNEHYANTKFKDSVFIRYLAESDERLVEVYNAVAGTNYPLDTPVQKNTLVDVLYKDRINDISFTLDGHTLVLFEHQSTVNENMPVRLLFYVAKLYEKEIRMNEEVSIYQRKRISLPTPRFVVLYNGKEPLPEYSVWHLSESFIGEQENPALELNVEVYNITYSSTSELLQRSAHLNDYSYFIHLVNEARKTGKPLDEAIKEASECCIAQGKMKSFLQAHATEVEQMLITEWDWDECLDVERKEARAEGLSEGFSVGIAKGLAEGRTEGRAEGLAEGHAEGIVEGRAAEREKNIRALGDVLPPETIAEKFEVSVEYVKQILQEHKN